MELSTDRKLRERNKISYRFAHWPIWIWVFFIAPGPITFTLFANGGDRQTLLWLLIVLAGTGIAGDIEWNFAKFLVNRKGQVVNRFAPGHKPTEPDVISAIETELARK